MIQRLWKLLRSDPRLALAVVPLIALMSLWLSSGSAAQDLGSTEPAASATTTTTTTTAAGADPSASGGYAASKPGVTPEEAGPAANADPREAAWRSRGSGVRSRVLAARETRPGGRPASSAVPASSVPGVTAPGTPSSIAPESTSTTVPGVSSTSIPCVAASSRASSVASSAAPSSFAPSSAAPASAAPSSAAPASAAPASVASTTSLPCTVVPSPELAESSSPILILIVALGVVLAGVAWRWSISRRVDRLQRLQQLERHRRMSPAADGRERRS